MWWNNFLRWAGTKMIMATEYQSSMDLRYIESCIRDWVNSPLRNYQIMGERYYMGDHDILQKKRTILGSDGKLEELTNLPNNKRIDNQYAKYVDQKKNYLLGKPITINCEDEEYAEKVKKIILSRKMRKTMKDLGEDCINGGIAWLSPYYDEEGKLQFKEFPAYEILPNWADRNHTILNWAVRLYEVEQPTVSIPRKIIQKVELYSLNGIDYYTFENNKLVPDVKTPHADYIKVTTGDKVETRNWERIPMIPFKFNAKEIPLLKRCKSLQDGVNEIISAFKDNMEEDCRNTILVLENYDGTDLEEFRKNLAQYGVIKVGGWDGSRGDVRTLQVEVNYANYESILSIFRTAIKHNCRGYDYSDLNKAAADPNQMNIKSILSDVDIDANDTETEYQAALEQVMWFINKELGVPDDKHDIEFIFNRDGIINEVDIMQMLVACGIRIPNELLLHQVPFINDVEKAMELLEAEDKKAMQEYESMMPINAGQRMTRPVKNAGGTVYGNNEQRK